MDIKTASPREMALEIMNRALQMSKGIPKDDMIQNEVHDLWKRK